jgi:hypothetical protein
MFGSLKGYKTYIVAGVTILGAVAGYVDGDVSKVHAIQLCVQALFGLTLRSAITTETAA